MHILIVEDEPDIRKTIEYNFLKEGFKVSLAGSISRGRDIVFSDSIKFYNLIEDVTRKEVAYCTQTQL